MKAGTLITALALAIAALLLSDTSGVAAADDKPDDKPKVHTVLIEGMRFQPEGLTVAAGDTVVWINRDMVPHTATSSSGHFDSGELSPGKSWTHIVHDTGEFAYTCTYHPLMKAILRVR